MAKRATPSDAGNGFDGDVVQGFVDEIEAVFEDMASSKGQHMKRCREARKRITLVYDRAKDTGIPRRALKAIVDIRRLDEKRAQKVEELEGEDAETFEQIVEAIGGFAELPLGKAAVERARQDGGALGQLNS